MVGIVRGGLKVVGGRWEGARMGGRGRGARRGSSCGGREVAVVSRSMLGRRIHEGWVVKDGDREGVAGAPVAVVWLCVSAVEDSSS